MKLRTLTGITAATGIAIALPLLAAERLAVKTGLWENTVTLQISDVKLPAAQLERMTPEQRAQLEAIMKQMGVGAPTTTTDRSCLTEKDLDGNAFRDQMEGAENCDFTQVTATSKRQEWSFTCRTDEGEAAGHLEIDVLNDSLVRGAMQGRMPQGNIDMKFEAKWQAGDCGAVAPD